MRLKTSGDRGEIETAELFWNASTYANPWLRHVLALRLQGAFGRGTLSKPLHGLGQPAERNVFFDALDEINMGSGFCADIQAIQRWETGTYWRQGNIVSLSPIF